MLSNYAQECIGLMTLPSGRETSEVELPCSLHPCGRYGRRVCEPLQHLAAKLNRGIQSGPFSEVPVCTLFGLWNPVSGRLELLNAGIPHGLHCRPREGTTVPIQINGTPLGVFPEPDLEGTTLQLEPGDRFLFGTDGFFEVMSPDRRTFQDSAPAQWGALAGSPLDWALSVICEAARTHGDGIIDDDLLVVGFEQPSLEQTPDELMLRLPSTPRAIDMACERLKACLNHTPGWAVRQARGFDIVLAVREALINAVIHGNGNRPGASVALHCRADGQQGLLVSVADEGGGFNLEAHRPPEDALSERGRGIPLIRHHAQEVKMTGNTLTMRFQIEETRHDPK
jgi:anti-sigma regulatory factor (Ser/Thr protein kinase)